MRVLHGVGTVGGQPQALARAERGLGLDSRCVTLVAHPFGYAADEVLLAPGDRQITIERKRWQLVRRAVTEADVVHCNFGLSLLPGWDVLSKPAVDAKDRLYHAYVRAVRGADLRWLKARGVGICVSYQGDDARQGDVSSARFPVGIVHEVAEGYYTPRSDAAKRADIAMFDQWADRIYYLNPDLGWVLPSRAQFLPYATVDLAEWQPRASRPTPARPLVVHAPSHRGAKGTRFVLDAVARLQAEGVPFDFQLIEGMAHAEARRWYERADLLVDQLLAGWYGGLAVELMALGTPVVCYLRDTDFGFLPPALRAALPLIPAAPDTITDVLRTWLTTGRDGLAARGMASRTFVEAWHDPRSIAARLRLDYAAISRRRRTA